MTRRRYRDRAEAGRGLSSALSEYSGRSDVIVLGLPRGGVPVAFEVARSFQAPLDVMLVRKLGAPGQPELAMGAIASGGVRVLNQRVLESLGVSEGQIEEAAERERAELQRREAEYRGTRRPPRIGSRCVILVDDGVATGATMRAALEALRELGAEETVAAAGVAPAETVERLREVADEVVIPMTPPQFGSVGAWFEEFDQTSDEDVRALLERAWSQEVE